MTSAIANHGRTLAPLMRQAGFRYVFLGIENILDEDLEFLRAEAKNRRRGDGAAAATRRWRRSTTFTQNKMYVVGGIDRRQPQDTRASIETNLDFVRRYVDVAVHPAPDALPADADDEDLPGAGADHQRAARGLRRHDRRGADGASRVRRDRVPALAGRPLDQAEAPAGGPGPHTARSHFATGSRCCGTRSGEPAFGRSWASRTSANRSSATAPFAGPSGCTSNTRVDTCEPV